MSNFQKDILLTYCGLAVLTITAVTDIMAETIFTMVNFRRRLIQVRHF